MLFDIKMAACLSGAVASALTFDQISAGDQVGLLLGKVVIDVKDTVSDSQISTTKVDTSVHIFSHVPCPHSLWFYDKTGKVVDSNLKALIKERQKEIVGWYRFRRHSSLRVSLRETAVHRSLLQTLGVPQTEHFVFLLTTASATTNLSTHSYDHVIYKLTSSNEFTSMSLSVINLGDTTHSQYKHHSAIVTPTGTGRYHSVVKKFENQFHDETGGIREVSLIQELAANLISQLEKISLLVSGEEKQLEELEKEVEKYEQVAKQLNNRPKSGLSPLSQNSSQNSGGHDEEDNTNKQMNRESVPTDKERLITDFLNNSESEHKIQLEVHLTKSQQGNNSSGLFGGDTFMSSSSSSSSTSVQPTQNTGESLLHKLPNEHDTNLSAPLKPSTITAANNNTTSTSNRKSIVVRGEAPHMSAVTATTIKNVSDTGSKRPASASDHFSFVENVLKEAKELPEINGEESLRLDNCVTVPMGAQLQSPPGVANMCSQMSKNNSPNSRNDSLAESTNSNTNAVPTTTSSTGPRRRARSRSDQQQQSGSMTVGRVTSGTRSYSPLSARNASPSPTPASSGTDGGGGGSPRHIRTRTPTRSMAVSTTASTRESRIDSNRSSGSVTSSKVDSLNKDVQKSPVRRCRRTRPNERTLSLSNSPSRREVNSIDYSSVRCERPVSPFL